MICTPGIQSVEWHEDAGRISCISPAGLVFDDSSEHWRHAVLRLLNLSEEAGRAWVESVAAEAAKSLTPFQGLSFDDRLSTLSRATLRALPRSERNPVPLACFATKPFDDPIDHVWFHSLHDDPNFCVVGNRRLQHGVLAQFIDNRWTLVKPPPYEEEYFEGHKPGLGYGNYRAQAGWRLEKAARLVRKIRGIAQYVGGGVESGTRLLDVGSGYGYFCAAASDVGWSAQGVEISRHAAAVSTEAGIDTFVGDLAAFALQNPGSQFDIVTLLDVVEHVEDPIALLTISSNLLKPGGLCVIRTPNLLAVEAEVMGSYYHSLKAEHLHCFSARSLAKAMLSAGLQPSFFTSESHLFKGFLGPAVEALACELRGSDLFVVAQK